MKQLAENLYAINTGKVNVYLHKAADGLTLIDTGVAGVRAGLERQLQGSGFAMSDIKRILITHAHVDHVGGLAELQAATDASAWAHRLDAPIVRGESPVPLPNSQDVSRQDKLIGALISSFVGSEQLPARVDRELEQGEFLDEVHPGLELVHLPGHSPGQIGFWFKQERVLIGGDVMMHLTPWLTRPLGAYTPDMAAANRSILKVAELRVKTLGLGHGAPLVGNAERAINKLADKLRRLGAENKNMSEVT